MEGEPTSAPDPTKERDYWGKYAAVDVLNLEKNEGKHFNGELDLLFVGGKLSLNLECWFLC